VTGPIFERQRSDTMPFTFEVLSIKTRTMNHSTRTLISAAALLTITSLTAQDKTKEGYSLSWNNDITVVPDSLTNTTHRLPAYRITVFESNGGDALNLWKDEMKSKSKSVSGSNPTTADVVVLPAVSTLPIKVFANATTDKKAEIGQLIIAYALNDSVGIADMALAETNARAMAVALNKANVQKQIDQYTKTLDKAEGKLEGAQKDLAKNDKALEKAKKAGEKAKKAVLSLNADISKLKSEVTGLESKFGITKDPKDLKPLTKARGKLSKKEGQLAKAMKSENKAYEDVSKYSGKSPDRAKEEAERAETMNAKAAIVESLKKKMETIK